MNARRQDAERRQVVWWARLLSHAPMPVLHGLAALAWRIGWHLTGEWRRKMYENVERAFSGGSARENRKIMRHGYANAATIVAEMIKSLSASPQWLARRVALRDVDLLRELLYHDRRIVLVAAHQANFEWFLHALSLAVDAPVHVGYKPLHNQWADTALKHIRSRFGAKLVPAKDLVRQLLRARSEVRIVALVADQASASILARHWTVFLNQDTAFPTGPEQIARMLEAAVVFVGLRRITRARYEATFEILANDVASLARGEVVERYARRVERQVRERPGEWVWPLHRWRLKRPVGSTREGGPASPADR